MRRMLFGVFVGAFVLAVTTQARSRLDESILGDFRIANPRLLEPCEFGVAMHQLAREAKVLLGYEQPRTCWLVGPWPDAGDSPEVLTGMTARQALDHLVAMVPAYRWQEIDGVIVVRPKEARDDPRNPLNLPTAPFEVPNGHSHGVLETMLRAVTPSLLTPHMDVPSRSINRPVSVSFLGGTLLDALNALVRAHGDSEWQFGYEGARATVVVNTIEVSLAVVMAPVTLPRPR